MFRTSTSNDGWVGSDGVRDRSRDRLSLEAVRAWGCLVTQRCSPGHARTGSPGRRLPALGAVDGAGLSTANRHRVQVSRVSVKWPRRRGGAFGRWVDGRRRLRALLKAGLGPAGGDAGPKALHLTSTAGVRRDAGDGLAPRAESGPRSTGQPGGMGWGGVASSLVGGLVAAPVTIEHHHLSNNRLQATWAGWEVVGRRVGRSPTAPEPGR